MPKVYKVGGSEEEPEEGGTPGNMGEGVSAGEGGKGGRAAGAVSDLPRVLQGVEQNLQPGECEEVVGQQPAGTVEGAAAVDPSGQGGPRMEDGLGSPGCPGGEQDLLPGAGTGRLLTGRDGARRSGQEWGLFEPLGSAG